METGDSNFSANVIVSDTAVSLALFNRDGLRYGVLNY